MDVPLQGKRALVTGAAAGIGWGCALALARAGADVALNDLPGNPRLAQAVAALTALGRQAVPVPGNIFDRHACELVVRESLHALGRIDILVSNPARSVRSPFLHFPPEQFENVLTGTLTSGFYISQCAARHMVERGGGGKLVFISSVQAEIPYVHCAAYNAAKAGLNHMARTIAAELLPYRINVNVIEPGWIDTPGEHAAFGSEVLAAQAAQLPWGRLGTIEDVGQAAAFLCSPAADYITGAVLLVDGGYSLRYAALQSSSLQAAADDSRGPALQA